jgi:hypothetical protein
MKNLFSYGRLQLGHDLIEGVVLLITKNELEHTDEFGNRWLQTKSSDIEIR